MHNMDTLPNTNLSFVNNLMCYLMNAVTATLKKKKKSVRGEGKLYESSCLPSKRVEKGPTMHSVSADTPHK